MTQQTIGSSTGARAKAANWIGGRRLRVLLCASGVSFMIMLDSNIVAVSLPAIARSLNAVFTDIEWVVSAYILTFAALLMPSGALADRFGRRRLLIVGLAIFTLASLLCGLAPSALILNASRALQGIGAAIQLSAALAVLGHEFRDAERAKAFGFWGTVIGVAVAAGPVVGGLITSSFGWRWAFLVNVPVGCILLWLAAKAVEESRDPDARKLDIAGIVTFGSGLFCLIWALIDSSADGCSSLVTVLKLAAAVLLLICFVAAEFWQDRPMVDFSLFRKSTFLGSSVAMLGFASAAQVMMTYLPLYLQNVFAMSPAVAGLGMLPFALPLLFCPKIAVSLSTRISGRSVLTIGLLIVALGNLVTAALVASHLAYIFVALGMFVTGCGAGLLNGETAKVTMSVVSPDRSGMASGISATLRFVGLVTGVTGLGAVLATKTEQHLDRAVYTMRHAIDLNGAFQHLASRVVAGDIAGIVAEAPEPIRLSISEIARSSFAAGFAVVLFAAAIIAVLAAAFTFAFVSADETAPDHRRVTSSSNTPDFE